MKLKATKTLVNFINNEIKNNPKFNKFKNYQITLEKFTQHDLVTLVDANALFNINYNTDFDYRTNTYNIIMITYPLDFYATPKYLATCNLTKLFKNKNTPISIKNFLDTFFNEIEI